MRQFLVINQSSGYLTVDIVNAIHEFSDDITLVTGSSDIHLKNLNSSVKIKKSVSYKRDSMIKRTASWLFFTLHCFWLIKTKFRKHEVVMFTNPPTLIFLGLFTRTKIHHIVFDIYPDALNIIGIKKESPIFRLWDKVSISILKKGTTIITISSHMKSVLDQKLGNLQTYFVPLWPSLQLSEKPNKVENPFLKQLGLQQKFIVLYSGNMGRSYDLSVVLDAAKLLQSYPDIHFILIGGGENKHELQHRIELNNLSNVSLLPWQPEEMMKFTIPSADIAVVMMPDSNITGSIPSKTFNYLAAGSAILCIASNETEVSKIINEHHCGISINHTEASTARDFIAKLYNEAETLAKFKNNSAELSKKFTIENARTMAEIIVGNK